MHKASVQICYGRRSRGGFFILYRTGQYTTKHQLGHPTTNEDESNFVNMLSVVVDSTTNSLGKDPGNELGIMLISTHLNVLSLGHESKGIDPGEIIPDQ